MDELTKLIVEELGPRALQQVPDFYAFGWSLPLTEAGIGQFQQELSFEKVGEIKEIHRRLVYGVGRKRSTYPHKNYTSLAAGLVGHDLGNIWAPMSLTLEMVSDKVLRERAWNDEQKRLVNVNGIFRDVTNYRAFCLTMAYIASEGDNSFTFSIPVEQLPYLAPKRNVASWEIQGQEPSAISSADYVALWQILKNTPTPASVRIHPEQDQYSITVQDAGLGICDKEGRPLPPSRLEEIFGEFSTKEGGLGLQIVKAITQLRGGYVSVATTPEGDSTFSYDTKEGICRESPAGEKGTTFTLYFPQ